MVRPVEEVTELELQRICSNVKEKVYNSSTVGPTFTLLISTRAVKPFFFIVVTL